ncbi:MAG: tripartite tricarboxylate transporter substrate binding protein [Alphaproteobacteria bacterium]|nr:tripartite tricarboxylate transporter substrate binding protein [Alphaproteobacteria bacterium]
MISRLLLAAFVALVPVLASAQTYPAKPIKLVVGFAAGGATDIFARLIAKPMSETLGQQVIIDNRPGGGGLVGTDLVAKSAPDGYTLLMGASSNLVMNVALSDKLPFDIDRDLVGVALVSRSPTILFVHPSFPARDLRDMIAAIKASPGKYTYGSAGNGSITHIIGASFLRAAGGLDVVHVAYRGAGPTVADLVAGHIHMAFDGMSSYLAYAKTGALRPIAVTPHRLSQAPEIPSFAESGLGDFEGYTWNAVLVPAGAPREVIARLNAAINAALAHPEVTGRFATLGVENLAGSSPESTDAFGRKERAKWVPLVRAMGISAD